MPTTTVDLLVDGQLVGSLEAPVRRNQRCPLRSLWLADYRGKEILLELVQRSSDERAWMVWETLCLVDAERLETERIKPVRK